MKLKFQQPKGQRIKSQFMWMLTHEAGWWFSETKNRWIHQEDPEWLTLGGLVTSAKNCHSVRAFRRMLKKAPNGVEFVLVSRWKYHNVYGRGSRKTKCKT